MRRMWMLLLVLVLTVVIMAVPAMAEETHEHGTCIVQTGTCETCGTAHGDGWTELTADTEELVDGGKYYLTGDISKAVSWSSGTVTICLNGHTWSGVDTTRPLTVSGGTVNIVDCSERTNYVSGGTLKGVKNLSVEGGTVYVTGGTVNFYNGTITGGSGNQGGNVSLKGTSATNLAVFNFLGGEIVGAGRDNLDTYTSSSKDWSVKSYDNGGIANRGGNVRLNAYSRFYMGNDTTKAIGNGTAVPCIRDGIAFNNQGGNVSSGVATGQFYLRSGVIKDGSSSDGGGNFHIGSGYLDMSGGLITGGAQNNKNTAANASNIHMNAGTFIMSGGQIDGCVWAQQYQTSSAYRSAVKLSGTAKILGLGLHLNATTSGSSYYGITALQVGDFEAGAEIYVRTDVANFTNEDVTTQLIIKDDGKGFMKNDVNGDGEITWADYEDVTRYIHGVADYCGVSYEEDGIYLRTVADGEIYHCVCSGDQPAYYNEAGKIVHIGTCDVYDHAWTPWPVADNGYFPGATVSNVLNAEAGYYYLVENDGSEVGDADYGIVTLNTQSSLSTAGKWFIDMNGLTITSARRVFSLQADKDTDATLTDSKGTGTFRWYTDHTVYNDHSYIWVRRTAATDVNSMNKELNVYRLTFDGSELTLKNSLIGVATGSAFFYDVTVEGATCSGSVGGAFAATNGGNLTLDGCTVSGGTANTSGGNINFASTGTLTIRNSTISGGTGTAGGNIYVSGGTTTIENSVIKDGTAVRKANTYNAESTHNTADYNEDGKIDYPAEDYRFAAAGNITARGANIYAGSNMTLTGCTISGGTIEFASGEFEADQLHWYGTYLETLWKNYGATGVFASCGSGKSVTLNDCKVYGNTQTQEGVAYHANRGGTIYAQGNATLNLNGTLVTASPVEECGAVLHMANADVNLNDYTRADGTVVHTVLDASCYYTADENGVFTKSETPVSASYGVAVHQDNSWTLTMNGHSTIYGGKATFVGNGHGGGAVYMDNAGSELVMNDNATVEGGNANYGGNIWTRGLITMNDDASIVNGTAERMAMENGKLSTGGGANVYMYSGTFTMNGGLIDNGIGTNVNGGNIRLDAGTFNLNDGTISGGQAIRSKENGANGIGGNFALYGTLNMNGGEIKGGVAAQYGDNIGVNSSATLNLLGGHIHGYVYINNYSNQPKLTIGGSIQIHTNTTSNVRDKGLYINGDSVKGAIPFAVSGLTADAKVDLYIDEQADAYVITNNDVQLTGENANDLRGLNYLGDYYINYGTKTETVEEVETTTGYLYLTAESKQTTGVAYNDSVIYATLDEASAVVTDGDFLKLFESFENGSIPASITLDLNGKTLTGLTVTEGKKISLFDSSASDYSIPEGKITLTSGTSANFEPVMLTGSVIKNNYRYITVVSGDQVTAHRIYLAVKSAVLYPAADPVVAYRIVLRCDETVAGLINGYGLQLAADNTVPYDFFSKEGFKLNAWDGSDDNSKVVVLGNVLSHAEGADNATRAATVVKGNAFLKINNGFAEDYTITSSNYNLSLKSLVENADNVFADLSDAQKESVATMYNSWTSVMEGWNVTNIKAYVAPTEE